MSIRPANRHANNAALETAHGPADDTAHVSTFETTLVETHCNVYAHSQTFLLKPYVECTYSSTNGVPYIAHWPADRPAIDATI
jgi:hypothetical protein